jgi:AraC-like DNA-binding protein
MAEQDHAGEVSAWNAARTPAFIETRASPPPSEIALRIAFEPTTRVGRATEGQCPSDAGGFTRAPEIARELGVSERTLQRRMTEEASSFRQLLLEARQELGRHLLGDPAAEIEEIAYLLGYQDTGSFYRAFRDWEGLTPGRWRHLNGSQEGRPDQASS